jgi:hypothetical protein
MRRLADEAVADPDESIDPVPDLFAQVQAEAATTWRAPSVASAPVRGSERLRAWHVTSPSRSLHGGVGTDVQGARPARPTARVTPVADDKALPRRVRSMRPRYPTAAVFVHTRALAT